MYSFHHYFVVPEDLTCGGDGDGDGDEVNEGAGHDMGRWCR